MYNAVKGCWAGKNVENKTKLIPELVSGSSTQVVAVNNKGCQDDLMGNVRFTPDLQEYTPSPRCIRTRPSPSRARGKRESVLTLSPSGERGNKLSPFPVGEKVGVARMRGNKLLAASLAEIVGLTPNLHPKRPCRSGVSLTNKDFTPSRHPELGSGSHCFSKGFTLIELLVVVLIIGILAAVALPQYQKAVMKSRLAEYEINLKMIAEAANVCYLQKGNHCTTESELSIGIPSCKPLPGYFESCSYNVNPGGHGMPAVQANGKDWFVYALKNSLLRSYGPGGFSCNAAPIQYGGVDCEKLGFTQCSESFCVRP